MVELAIVEGSDMTRDRLEVAEADFSAAMDSRSYGSCMSSGRMGDGALKEERGM